MKKEKQIKIINQVLSSIDATFAREVKSVKLAYDKLQRILLDNTKLIIDMLATKSPNIEVYNMGTNGNEIRTQLTITEPKDIDKIKEYIKTIKATDIPQGTSIETNKSSITIKASRPTSINWF